MKERILISLPTDLKAELDRFAESRGVSRSEMVREALREYLFVRKVRALRRRLIPYAQAKNVSTDEDVFRVVS
jgi:metal-responsive CopG/Arc/MetJ family transcriptional regulator